MIIGPITVTRGNLVPYIIEVNTPQNRRTAGDGSVTVVEKAYTREQFFRAKFKTDKDEADHVESFLTHGVGFARQTFTLVDGFGDSYTVRFWDRRVRKRVVFANVVEFDLLFREEVVGP